MKQEHKLLQNDLVICNLFTFRKSTIEYGTSQVIQNKNTIQLATNLNTNT
jgi:hypothetical protein